MLTPTVLMLVIPPAAAKRYARGFHHRFFKHGTGPGWRIAG
jgi:hypothetical protein